MVMKAIKDKVFAKVLTENEQTTPGGLIVPGTVRKEPQKYGLVISVGDNVKEIQMGDTIMFHDRGGQTILIDGEEHRVLSDNEIYGVTTRKVASCSCSNDDCGH